jgi:hypothetical protein
VGKEVDRKIAEATKRAEEERAQQQKDERREAEERARKQEKLAAWWKAKAFQRAAALEDAERIRRHVTFGLLVAGALGVLGLFGIVMVRRFRKTTTLERSDLNERKSLFGKMNASLAPQLAKDPTPPFNLRKQARSIKFSVGAVTAIDDEYRPHVTPGEWSAWYDQRIGSFILNSSSSAINYCLRYKRTDVVYAGVDKEREVSKFGKTLLRMGVTGLGWALVKSGSGLGASILDARYAGAIKQVIVSGLIVFRDHTVLVIEGVDREIASLLCYFPSEILSDTADNSVNEDVEILGRMMKDGPKVLQELDKEIRSLVEDVKSAKSEVSENQTFESRDAARRKHEELWSKLNKRVVIARSAYCQAPRAGLMLP